MILHLRKRIAQIGVLVFISSLLAPILPLPFAYFGGVSGLGVVEYFPLFALSGISLLVAALIPAPVGESWGSMWPLVGYDNAIDALYVRGPWLQRFEELDELEAERRTTTAMSEWF